MDEIPDEVAKEVTKEVKWNGKWNGAYHHITKEEVIKIVMIKFVIKIIMAKIENLSL